MKRIFHIISHYELGGAERVAMDIAQSGSKDFEYHLVEVIRGRSPFTRELLEEMRAGGIRYHRSPVPVLISFHYVFERLAALLFPLWFLWIFRRYRPDIIHCHTDIPEQAVWYFRRLFPRLSRQYRLARTIHNTELWHGLPKTGRRIEQMFQQTGANVAVSQPVADAYCQHYGMMPRVILNGVRTATHKPYPRLAKGKCNIIFAGRFVEQKGISCLVSIIKSLEHDPHYHFHVFGSGPLQSLVEPLGRYGNVSVNGPLFGLSAYLPSFDYVLMPSLHEGLAIVALEAAMSGVPVIMNDCPGLSDTVPPGWPLKVSGNSLEQYLTLFGKTLPAGSRDEWSIQARDYAVRHFSMETMQHHYEQFYHELTERHN